MIANPYEWVIPYKNSRNERRSWLAPSQIPKTFTYPFEVRSRSLRSFPSHFRAAISPRSGTGSKPPSCHGPHLSSLDAARYDPMTGPYIFKASAAYSEQLG